MIDKMSAITMLDEALEVIKGLKGDVRRAAEGEYFGLVNEVKEVFSPKEIKEYKQKLNRYNQR